MQRLPLVTRLKVRNHLQSPLQTTGNPSADLRSVLSDLAAILINACNTLPERGAVTGSSPVEQRFFDLSEVAKILGCSRTLVYSLIHSGQLPHVRLHGRTGKDLIRVPREAIDELIENSLRTK